MPPSSRCKLEGGDSVDVTEETPFLTFSTDDTIPLLVIYLASILRAGGRVSCVVRRAALAEKLLRGGVARSLDSSGSPGIG